MTIHVPVLATLLGVAPKRAAKLTTLDLADEIGNGLPATALARLCDKVAPDDPSFRYRIVPKATLGRRKRSARGRLSRDESDRLLRLARVWALAMDVWKSEADAQWFLSGPHPLLRNRVPRELAIEGELGARQVEELLNGIKYGIPT
jgi:putative toxin-antitoxin system antitoxin component (TIGR02293 family)